MRLQTRLTLTAAALITGVSLAVGSSSVIGGYFRELGMLKRQLNTAAVQITSDPSQALSSALLVGEQQNLTVGLLDINHAYSVLNDGNVHLFKPPARGTLIAAKNGAILRTTGRQHYVLRSISLPNNEWLVLALNYSQQLNALRQNQISLVLDTALADAIAVAATSLLMRRDLRGLRTLASKAQDLAAGKDVTFLSTKRTDEVNQLSAALNTMVEQLTANQNEMQRFLGDASHELRTPLTVIRGYLELFSGANLSQESGQKFVSNSVPKLQTEVLRMQQLIDDLLLLAELGDPGRNQVSEAVDLTSAVESQIASLTDLQSERPIKASVTEGVIVQGDPQQLNQLLNNLFGNIRRHTSETDLVEVSLFKDGASVLLTISDAGPGLSQEAYEKGVGAFTRFDSGRSRDKGGSGLGMSIMAGVVARHGGSLELTRSRLGGLQTQIILPA